MWQLERGKVIETIKELSPYYDLSFDIKPVGVVSDLSSIIRVTAPDGGNVNNGDRNPALFFFPDSTSLTFCSAVNGNPSYCWNYSPLPLNTYTSIRITQQSESGQVMYRIYVDGSLKHEVHNTQLVYIENAQVLTSDSLHVAANAYIKNYRLVDKKVGKPFIISLLLNPLSASTLAPQVQSMFTEYGMSRKGKVPPSSLNQAVLIFFRKFRGAQVLRNNKN